MLKLLNATDATGYSDDPHCGSVGHVLNFSYSCQLANQLRFDAVNIGLQEARENSATSIRDTLDENRLAPGAFASSALVNSSFSDAQFRESVLRFEADLKKLKEAGFRICLGHITPFSEDLNFHENFKLVVARLKELKPLLERNGIKLGLEFIGHASTREKHKFDFIHTLDGIRSLIAAAGLEDHAGIKLDTSHWATSGAGIVDLLKVDRKEVLYVELNDGARDHSLSTLPEFNRELPGATGVLDLEGFMKSLHAIGYVGPIAVEPWNEKIKQMTPEVALREIKLSLDRALSLIDSSYPNN